ncbi:MAG: Na(+)-translocating NADH-quinone reductase subunit A [Bacteroidales bacterium]|nr:Na(+)-translocating NADH-quinone reductase subunit A [Bacteroidales bacterium]
MARKEVIKIGKGLDIPLRGSAGQTLGKTPHITEYALKPTDYVGVVARLLVAEGDTVLAGTPLFEDKNNAAARFVSPVSGTVLRVVRGEKRRIEAVVVACDGTHTSVVFRPALQNSLEQLSQEDIRAMLINSGLWTTLVQRPFGIIPAADARPKAVFVSCFDTSPLPVDLAFALQGREEDFQWGVEVLHRLVGEVHLSVAQNDKKLNNAFFSMVRHASIHTFAGPHPAGLVGTQIAKIAPIDRPDYEARGTGAHHDATVWTLNVQDVATIGHLFRTGSYCPQRRVAVCGPVVCKPQYFSTFAGACVAPLLAAAGLAIATDECRVVSGNVLSGTQLQPDGFLSAAADKLSVLPEGDHYDMMGWLRPNVKKFSASRTFLSGIFPFAARRSTIDTGHHGSRRPLFVTGQFEPLVPLDIYPLQLIKACIIGDIEQMEALGIYEVEPEDLALCEFADTSKTEIQAIIRDGLEKIRLDS